MKKRILGVLVLGIFTFLGACSSKGAGATVITPEKAKEMMDTTEVIVVDVREWEEYTPSHVAGAINLPLGEIEAKADEILPKKDATILVYCRSGARSASAAKKLVAMGYTNVYDFGGIMSWPYDTVAGEE